MDIFLIAWIGAFATGIFGIIEMVSIHLFVPFFFRIGIPVFRKTIYIETSKFKIEKSQNVTKEEGKFNFTTDNKVFFLSRLFLFSFFRISTPIPFKITGFINYDNTIEIEARLPLSSTLFIAFWLIGWIVGAAFTGSGFGLIGVAFVAVIGLIAYPIEKMRTEKMIKELQEIITDYNSKITDN